MPVAPNAIDVPQPIAVILAPARPLPAAPTKADSVHPQTGEINSPRLQTLHRTATATIRGIIGSVATVGPNASRIGAPGILGLAGIHAKEARASGTDAIRSGLGNKVDIRA